MTADSIHFETLISVDGDEPISVLDFYNDNEFSDDAIAAFEDGLLIHGEVVFGGGAGAEFVVRLVQTEA